MNGFRLPLQPKTCCNLFQKETPHKIQLLALLLKSRLENKTQYMYILNFSTRATHLSELTCFYSYLYLYILVIPNITCIYDSILPSGQSRWTEKSSPCDNVYVCSLFATHVPFCSGSRAFNCNIRFPFTNQAFANGLLSRALILDHQLLFLVWWSFSKKAYCCDEVSFPHVNYYLLNSWASPATNDWFLVCFVVFLLLEKNSTQRNHRFGTFVEVLRTTKHTCFASCR